MQNYYKTLGVMTAVSALVAGNAMAEIKYNLHTGYSSEYLFRGLDLGDHLIETGLDAKTQYNGLELSAGAWYGSFNSSAIAGGLDSTELDLYASASKDLGFATASLGYIYYEYPQSATNAQQGFHFENFSEVTFGLSKDLGFASASLTYFWGVTGPSNEGYTELALSRGFELSPCLTLNIGSNLGYLVEGGDFTAWTTRVSLDYGFAEHAKVSPFVAGSIALGESTGGSWNSTDNELLAGSMLNVSF